MNSALNCKISFVGGGNMAQALIGGLLSRGFPATNITVFDPTPSVQDILQEKNIQVFAQPKTSYDSDVVILAVHPQDLSVALASWQNWFDKQLVISIVAGATINLLIDQIGHERIIRAMPNMPAEVYIGAHGMFAPVYISEDDKTCASHILSATGLGVWLSKESDLDAVTALSGSGPAYFFYMMESMIRAGKNLGLDEKTATTLTLQTALGAAQMAISSGASTTELRKKVTSAQGTTRAALDVFDQMSVSQSIQTALAAAQRRSQELAQELSDSTKSLK